MQVTWSRLWALPAWSQFHFLAGCISFSVKCLERGRSFPSSSCKPYQPAAVVVMTSLLPPCSLSLSHGKAVEIGPDVGGQKKRRGRAIMKLIHLTVMAMKFEHLCNGVLPASSADEHAVFGLPFSGKDVEHFVQAARSRC